MSPGFNLTHQALPRHGGIYGVHGDSIGGFGYNNTFMDIIIASVKPSRENKAQIINKAPNNTCGPRTLNKIFKINTDFVVSSDHKALMTLTTEAGLRLKH